LPGVLIKYQCFSCHRFVRVFLVEC
jgi:hypothetical protein